MKKLISIAIFSAVALAGPALAQEGEANDIARAVPVRYADLDLSRATDAAILLSRLHNAANAACERPEIAQQGPALRRVMDACRTRALEAAVARINEPQLTALYDAERD